MVRRCQHLNSELWQNVYGLFNFFFSLEWIINLLYQWQHCRNCWEAGWSAYGLSQALNSTQYMENADEHHWCEHTTGLAFNQQRTVFKHHQSPCSTKCIVPEIQRAKNWMSTKPILTPPAYHFSQSTLRSRPSEIWSTERKYRPTWGKCSLQASC